jgi:shikimate dehydrogenase
MSIDSNTALSRYGLIGRKLSHSWSKKYFNKRFLDDGISASYVNLEYDKLADCKKESLDSFSGLNVTVPYKEEIISLLDSSSPIADKIGAVNCIEIRDGLWIGHNTDAFGFRDSLRPFLKSWHNKALILGTGGASKAIAFVLEELGIEYKFVSRNPAEGQLAYDDLNAKAVEIFPFIINCTPLGMHPDIETCPIIPYGDLGEKNLLYDLVYNPEQSKFQRLGAAQGAQTINGYHMLIAQAEASWRIWNGGSAEPAI